MDVVFDTYLSNSLKQATREKKGKGVRRRVTKEGKCPTNWPMFLKEDQNKQELNIFLGETLCEMTYPPDKKLYVTSNEKVKSNCGETMPDSDHEEADTRLCLHIKDAIDHEMTNIKVKTLDTDVVLILVSFFHALASQQNSLTDIIVEFGPKSSHKDISIRNLATSLGQILCQAIPLFHSLTGYDTTSAFRNVGKRKAYDLLKQFPEAQRVFESIFLKPFQNLMEEDDKFKVIVQFVIWSYRKTSICTDMNVFRGEVYTRVLQQTGHFLDMNGIPMFFISKITLITQI